MFCFYCPRGKPDMLTFKAKSTINRSAPELENIKLMTYLLICPYCRHHQIQDVSVARHHNYSIYFLGQCTNEKCEFKNNLVECIVEEKQ